MLSILEKKQLVESYNGWWHSIDFGDGVVSNGEKGGGPNIHTQEIKWFPKDFFLNKRVLDVGAWDGYYSFYAERQGATEVVAVDKFVWTGQAGSHRSKRGFDIAHQLLNSKVKSYILSVEEMTPDILGTFDCIIYAGVFYHLKNPYQSLEILDTLLSTGGRIMLETHMCNIGNRLPLMQFHPKNSLNNDSTNYWSPNGSCLRLMFEEIGNYTVESLNEGGRGTIVVRKN
jgi:tRNA (mo5U34)-methyltransferase